MERKTSIDMSGATALIAFALLLGLNQVVIKVSGGGFGPVFQAALRSTGAVIVLLIWMRLKGVPLVMPKGVSQWGVLSGCLFAFEFICLFTALDLEEVEPLLDERNGPLVRGLDRWIPGVDNGHGESAHRHRGPQCRRHRARA